MAFGLVKGSTDSEWKQGFKLLKKYADKNGDCMVPPAHRAKGFKLGWWVISLRNRKESLTNSQRRDLDKLGFVWMTPAKKRQDERWQERWEQGFKILKKYRKRTGDCRVPSSHCEDDFTLGAWVSARRSERDSMTLERHTRLDALGFVWRVR